MINPLRSEQEAFKATIIIAILAAPVAIAALLFGGGVALGVAGGLVFAGLFALVRKRGEPGRDVVRFDRSAPDGRCRILVVANETLSGGALRGEIEYRATRAGGAEVRVVCPALNTKLKHWTSDEDAARQAAQKRLGLVLTALAQVGIEAQGDIGDDDPVQAMEDALRTFAASEAIVSTHPPGRSNWLEAGVVLRARERFEIPITHVIVDLSHEREFVAE
ncbi:MAG: hypothetical protein WDZ37_02750 [Solirubrobacterales bacterium]